jgi:hypothetical protein
MKKVRTLPVIAVAFMFLYVLGASPVFGDAVLTTDGRYVSANGAGHYCDFACQRNNGQPPFTSLNPTWNILNVPIPPFADFNSTAAAPDSCSSCGLHNTSSAQQTSSVSPTDFEVTSAVSINAFAGCNDASSAGCTLSGTVASVFDVGFTLSDFETYQFTGRNHDSGAMYLAKVGAGHIIDVPVWQSSLPPLPPPTTGILGPGSYVLHAEQMRSFGLLNGEGLMFNNFTGFPTNPTSAYQFSLQLQSAPPAVTEPSSLVVLVIGLAAIIGTKVNRNNHERT